MTPSDGETVNNHPNRRFRRAFSERYPGPIHHRLCPENACLYPALLRRGYNWGKRGRRICEEDGVAAHYYRCLAARVWISLRTGDRTPPAMAPAAQHLPVKAIMEGPSACFRLLDVDDGLGMKHADFVRLLYSATDNRLAGKRKTPAVIRINEE